jgi:hypothetical protein
VWVAGRCVLRQVVTEHVDPGGQHLDIDPALVEVADAFPEVGHPGEQRRAGRGAELKANFVPAPGGPHVLAESAAPDVLDHRGCEVVGMDVDDLFLTLI